MKPLLLLSLLALFACAGKKTERTSSFPKKEELRSLPVEKTNVWFFILAGQSNMAGRGQVEPEDTIPHERVLTTNQNGQWILAKEPLHFYEPNLAGLDCGLTFGRKLISALGDSITIVMLPAAVGGSSIQQWLGDTLHRKVKLRTNLWEKIDMARANGVLKAILWHQGESDAHPGLILPYAGKLSELFSMIRIYAQNDSLPILAGELGSFPKNEEPFGLINEEIRRYAQRDSRFLLVSTADLNHRGDSLHFNSEAQRKMGERLAEKYLETFRPPIN